MSNLTSITPYNPSTNVIFSPRQISGCALWLDAADSASVTLTGSNVTNVRDKSGQNVILSNATGFSYSNVFNGSLPSFFNPNGGRNRTNPTATLGRNASFGVTVPFTIFFAGLETGISTSNYGYICDSAPGGVNRPYILASNIQTPFGSGGGVSPVKTPFLACAQFYTSGGAMIVNGSNYYTQTSVLSAFTTGGITIGNRFTLDESWPGHLCEIIVYNKPVPTSERQQIEGYLAWKWGTQSRLPTTHPYYNNAYLPNSYPISYFPPRLTPTSVIPVVPGFTIPTIIQQYVFNPTSISGAALWLDGADDATVIRSGTNVTRWNDKSGNGNNAIQLTTSNMPIYLNIPAISQNGIYFASNSTNLTTINNNSTSGNTSRTIFAITYLPNSSSRMRIGTGTHATNTPPSAFGIDQDPPTTRLFAPYVYTVADNVLSVSLSGLQCIYAYYDSSVSQIGGGYGFTGFITKNTTLNTAATPWYFGLRPDNNGSLTSYVCEFLQYNIILTTTQRQQVEGYLAWKWGLQSSLPANHPFKLFPP